MKSMITTVIMLAMVLSIAAVKPNKRKRDCSAGMFFMKKCNYCWCTVKAMKKDAWCTNMPCKKGERGNRGLLHDRLNSPVLKLEPTYTGLRKASCTPGSTFKLDCNDCLCLNNGEAMCSIMKCNKGATNGRVYHSDTCKQGESWKEDCNKCHCPSSGLRSDTLCTRRKCTKANKVRLFPSNLRELNKLTSIYDEPSLIPSYHNKEVLMTPEYNEPSLFPSYHNKESELTPEYDEPSLIPSYHNKEVLMTPEYNEPSLFPSYHNKESELTEYDEPSLIPSYHNKEVLMTPEYIDPSLFPSHHNKESELTPEYNEPSLFPSNLNRVDRPTSKYNVFENATHCTPKTQFYLACNPCICQSSGIKSGSPCDNMGCPPFTPYYDKSAKCTPGTSYKQACNYCKCGKSGVVADSVCTLMRCTGTHP